MKAIKLMAVLGLSLTWNIVAAQTRDEVNMADSTGMPGDNFSLQGALGIFKESESLEDFEKKLNSKDNAVNNLDLNGDGKIDYVRVIDNTKDNAHAIVIQVPVSKSEAQDVAVIEIEKDGDQSAIVQIVGDEDLYGETTIVEPAENVEPADKGNTNRGPSAYSPGRPGIYVNVWFWPCVRFMYAPAYVVWVSPWYYDYYPMWWSPWAPYPWRWHHMHCWHYHHYYHYADFHRTTYANQVYAPRRNRSSQVNERYRDARAHFAATQSSRPPRTKTQPGRPSRPDQTTPGRPSRPTDVTPGRPARPTDIAPGRPQRPDQQYDKNPTSRPQTKPAPRPTKPTVKPSTRPKTVQSKPRTSSPSRSGGASKSKHR
jgi:hypothetical protein